MNEESVVPLHIGNLLLQFPYLLFLQDALVFDRHHLDEVFHIARPVIKHLAGQLGTSVEVVLAYQFVQFLAAGAFFHQVDFHHVHVAVIVEIMPFVPHVGHAATHACRKVSSGFTQHDHAAPGHVFATMVSRSFDDGDGPGIAHGESFPHFPVDIQLA